MLREWLPRLAGIEREVQLQLGRDDGVRIVRGDVDSGHLAQLTRDEMTSAVHYIHFRLDDPDVAAMAAGPVILAVTHESYRYETRLTEISITELLGDLGN